MKERLQKIKEEAIARIKESKNPESLNDVRVSVLGKKGELTALLKSMKDVAPDLREILGLLSGTMNNEKMTDMTYAVDVEGRSVEEVAREFLIENNLLDA